MNRYYYIWHSGKKIDRMYLLEDEPVVESSLENIIYDAIRMSQTPPTTLMVSSFEYDGKLEDSFVSDGKYSDVKNSIAFFMDNLECIVFDGKVFYQKTDE